MSSAMPVPGAFAIVMLPARYTSHDACHAEHRIGAERERIEERVVDAAVQHVDRLEAFGRAHRDAAVDHLQVAALDEV
ncbi:hypothetical protein M4S82_16220, partial [Planococcus sp. MERTA32b]|nr:hypothetical protein [Planococcus sp. MER TA 32b]